MRISGIVAITEPVKRGDAYSRFSVEALEGMKAMGGVPVIHGHNPLLLPLGKTERTWVEKSSATEASLYQDIYSRIHHVHGGDQHAGRSPIRLCG